MKFFDILKISVHNLLENKLRSALTVAVIAVISFFVIFISSVCFSIYKSSDINAKKMYESCETYFTVEKIIKAQENYNHMPLTVQEAQETIGKMEGGGIFTYISISPCYYSALNGEHNSFNIVPFYAKTNIFEGRENHLHSGRMWDASDENTNNIWLDYSEGLQYAVGDTVSLKIYINGKDDEGKPLYEEKEFKIQGFINYNANSVYMEYHQFDKVNSVTAVIVPKEGGIYGMPTQYYLRGLSRDIKVIPSGTGEFQITCDLLDTFDMVLTVLYAAAGLALFISVIILLLTAGCAANTIKISAHKYRRFFGVMKALGLKNGRAYSILVWQVIILTLLGILAAWGAALLSIGLTDFIVRPAIGLLFQFYEDRVTVCYISPLIPFALAFLTAGFILLYTKSELKTIAGMDAVSIIGEVD